ncbi:peptide chain release factor N(5)-glutamine methyltransferase [Dietzia natronolimnaea]|uniref:peptide chain release factor N(5)-glutamine methyltransferase n=1 Tax=Dietzia natronolimnaea TaxID=161920 RepID=UPI001FE73B1D|nr:peptide chain release factor N(5)-glutamine methyltransferase [Dietzia natronolimnaea]
MHPRPVPATAVVRSAAHDLRAAGVDSAVVEAQLICAHVLGIDRSALPLADAVDASGLAEIDRMVAARIADRTPIQYLLGRAVSGRLDLAVGPGVFIPRPETELLVEDALAALPAPGDGPGPVVVDLCAGSGTLALEIAHARPDARVHAVELHDQALDWLRRNAAERAAAGDTPLVVHSGDATDPGILAELRGRVDAVVSNPPYIPRTDDLPAEVLGHEPATALFGGVDGLAVITPLVGVAAGLLAPGGHLAVEHDEETGASVASVVEAQGRFGTVEQHTDLAGRPRFVTATRLGDRDDDDELDPTVRKGTTR